MNIELVTDVDTAYAQALADGTAGDRESFAAYMALWNTQAPLINEACNPMACLESITNLVLLKGAEGVRARITYLADTGMLCSGCANASLAAVEVVLASIGHLRPQLVVAEAQALLTT